jgi:hypothetical protein
MGKEESRVKTRDLFMAKKMKRDKGEGKADACRKMEEDDNQSNKKIKVSVTHVYLYCSGDYHITCTYFFLMNVTSNRNAKPPILKT